MEHNKSFLDFFAGGWGAGAAFSGRFFDVDGMFPVLTQPLPITRSMRRVSSDEYLRSTKRTKAGLVSIKGGAITGGVVTRGRPKAWNEQKLHRTNHKQNKVLPSRVCFSVFWAISRNSKKSLILSMHIEHIDCGILSLAVTWIPNKWVKRLLHILSQSQLTRKNWNFFLEVNILVCKLTQNCFFLIVLQATTTTDSMNVKLSSLSDVFYLRETLHTISNLKLFFVNKSRICSHV